MIRNISRPAVHIATVVVFVATASASACVAPGSASCTCSGDTSGTATFEGATLSFASAQSLDPSASAIVLVHVYSNDFSTNPAGGAVVDATVRVGDTVRWVFDDSFHSATSVSGSAESFDSGLRFSPGETFDHTFTKLGNFQYYCTAHGGDLGNGTALGMAGVIRVIAVPEPTAILALPAAAMLMKRRRRVVGRTTG